MTALEQSGDSVAKFCEKRGIRVALLKWWRWRLRKGSTGTQKARKGARKLRRKPSADVRLVPIDVVGLAARRSADSALSIVVSDLQVRVEVGADIAYVGALVRELRSGC